ncbi:MAG: O-succinylbenzoate synthase, partial [Actinomycetota bacterium]
METYGFSIPLKYPLRGVTESRGILVSGPAGWGEYSPVPGYSGGKQQACWRAAVAIASEEKPAPVRDGVAIAVLVPEVSAERAAE